MPYVDPYSQLYDEYTQRAALAPQQTSTPNIPPGASSLPTPTAADLAARDAVSTRTVYGPGGSVTTDTRPAYQFNNAANAPAVQGAFMDDPFYQRSDVQPLLQATNRDVQGGGAYGYRNWMRSHPVGTIAAMIAAAYGGSLAAGGAGGVGGGAGGAGGVGMAEGGGALTSDAALGSAVDSSVGIAGTGGGLGGAAGAGAGAGVGFGGAGTAGLPANLAGDFAASSPYGGAAGQLAANGGIAGGAGTAGSGFAGSNWGRLLTGAGRQLTSGGSSGQQGVPPAPAPVIGGFMGSPMASQSYTAPQRMPLNESTTRARGYMRKPLQFNGATIWV